MIDKVRVAAAQVAPVLMDREATVEKTCRVIEEVGRKKAQLVVFPETFIPGFPYWRGVLPISRWSELMVEYQKNALTIPGPDTEVICEAARDAGVICAIGCTERSDLIGSETLYNTILFIDGDGRILGRHRKLMPTHGERMVWGMGDGSDIIVFDTPVGRVGGLVCYEHHMTLLKAAMGILGEEIHCAVWPGYWLMDRHPGSKRRYKEGESIHLCDIEHAVREYAFENQCFVISAGQYLPDEEMPPEAGGFNVAAGGSLIVNPAGVVLAGPLLDREEILYADLDADDRRLTKAYFDALGHYSRWDVMTLRLDRRPLRPLAEEEGQKERLKEIADRYGIDYEELMLMFQGYQE